MSVRHVHAKRGEYIAVHRDHDGGSSGGGDDCDGCFVIITICFVIFLIASC